MKLKLYIKMILIDLNNKKIWDKNIKNKRHLLDIVGLYKF